MSLQIRFPHYEQACRDFGIKNYDDNLKYREKVYALGKKSKQFAEEERQKCQEDILYFCCVYLWTDAVKQSDPSKRRCPFMLWDFQQDFIVQLKAHFNFKNYLLEKSREMGGSWLVLAALLHSWLYEEGFKALVCSRTEELVEKTDDMNALFPKLDYLLENMPAWMLPKGFDMNKHRTKRHCFNPEMKSSIDGQSTVDDIARGARLHVVFLDEFAAVPLERQNAILTSAHAATKCILMVSTHKGVNTAFFDRSTDGVTDKMRLHWPVHPEFGKATYKVVDGKVDSSFSGMVPLPHKPEEEVYFPDYYPLNEIDALVRRKGVQIADKLRSPWWDRMAIESTGQQEMAQEYDCDPLGSDDTFFDANVIRLLRTEYASRPQAIGEFDHTSKTFRVGGDSSLEMWIGLAANGRPPRGSYGVAADISQSTGMSDTVFAVINMDTGERVAQFAKNQNFPPEYAAYYAVALAEWFWDAMLIWDAGGPGHSFGGTVMQIGYGNIYWKTDEIAASRKTSDKPGFYFVGGTDGGPRLRIIAEFRRALTAREYTERSESVYDECLKYVFKKSGPEHAKSESLQFSSSGKNHGDRVIAACLAWHICRIYGKGVRKKIDLVSGPSEKPAIVPTDCAVAMIERSLNQQAVCGYR